MFAHTFIALRRSAPTSTLAWNGEICAWLAACVQTASRTKLPLTGWNGKRVAATSRTISSPWDGQTDGRASKEGWTAPSYLKGWMEL